MRETRDGHDGGSGHLLVAILAGGAGRRLTAAKPLLTVGGRSLVERVASAAGDIDRHPLIVTNSPEPYAELGFATARDLHSGTGPLGGILTALRATQAERVLVLAADLPFLQPALLAAIASKAEGVDCAIPEWDERLQPLHAVYARTCAEPIVEMIEAGTLCPLDLYPRVRTRVVSAEEVAQHDPQGLSFFNVNTPDDLAEAEALACDADALRREGVGKDAGETAYGVATDEPR